MTDRPYDDLERPSLVATGLTRDLVGAGSPWREIRVVESTGSTNSDLVDAAKAGAGPGLVLIAERQTHGRGRLDRQWSAPRGSGLTLSLLLRPAADPASWGWLPLLAGLGVAGPLARLSGLDVQLKWPNDVLIGDRKVAGILAERVGDQVVIGLGLNVSLSEAELPVVTATSLLLEGSAVLDRETLLRAVVRGIGERVNSFDGTAAAVSAARSDYRARCVTLGKRVRAELPGGGSLVGEAVDIDESGRLVIAGSDGARPVGAGDIIHLR